MKKTRLFFGALSLVCLFVLAGCEKDEVTSTQDPTEQEDPDDPPAPQGDERFAGTSWMASAEGSYRYYGYNLKLDLVAALDFNMDTTGELFIELTTSIPSMPSYSPQINSTTVTFSYMFDGNQGVITERGVINGEEYTEEYIVTYDEENKTLTMDLNDDEMAEMMGSSAIVFERVY